MQYFNFRLLAPNSVAIYYFCSTDVNVDFLFSPFCVCLARERNETKIGKRRNMERLHNNENESKVLNTQTKNDRLKAKGRGNRSITDFCVVKSTKRNSAHVTKEMPAENPQNISETPDPGPAQQSPSSPEPPKPKIPKLESEQDGSEDEDGEFEVEKILDFAWDRPTVCSLLADDLSCA